FNSMLRTFLHAKIHSARVTDAQLNYRGSITIDQNLLDASGILPFEMVQVVNINTGDRLETCVIAGAPGSGTLCLNGAAARLVQPGDKVMIMAYAQLAPATIRRHRVTIVLVDDNNRPEEVVKETINLSK